ncbi:MAG: Hg(II)-responsive transcriptional regulator [Acidobacteria bacterium RIFCSPLOWO2_02_FULL_65_29]|nr:MAG: Hg(II)-responsive transcriptional regulator [Acidobacteria bacterium RIFCSPLOWO2_02_FULL_65_29]
MSHDPLRVSIGAMANAAGVNVETIRFYQRRGLLAEPKRRYGEIRRYGSADVARVKFVKAAQRLGFSLDEIAGLLKLDDGTRCDEARGMAEEKLNGVRAKLRDLRRMESALKALIADCCAGRGTVTCPLIASLHSSDAR